MPRDLVTRVGTRSQHDVVLAGRDGPLAAWVGGVLRRLDPVREFLWVEMEGDRLGLPCCQVDRGECGELWEGDGEVDMWSVWMDYLSLLAIVHYLFDWEVLDAVDELTGEGDVDLHDVLSASLGVGVGHLDLDSVVSL